MNNNLYCHPKNSCDCNLFGDLHYFRNCIEEGKNGLQHYPYTSKKNKVFAYKTIFLGISTIFGLIAYYIHNAYFCWAFTFILGGQISPKILLTNIALILSLLSFSVALYINPVREIANHVTKKALRRVKKIYARRSRDLSCTTFTNANGVYEIRMAKRDTYLDLVESIHNHNDETIMTMKRINISKTLDETQKELLYNQAILELQYKLEGVVSAYQQNTF
ncbi:MAG: hypothetical protein VX777_03175 [Chlamydiota bacterium]|nr:hypothetical protein [Chlamydiota bacterium]